MNDDEAVASEALSAYADALEASAGVGLPSAEQRAHAEASAGARSRGIRELSDDLRDGKKKIIET